MSLSTKCRGLNFMKILIKCLEMDISLENVKKKISKLINKHVSTFKMS